MAQGRPDDRLEKQTVVLTVPASFDDVARNADRRGGTQGGAREPDAAGGAAGGVLLLAGDALRRRRRRQLKPGDRCLVVDVGGGTTDFSLIQAVEEKGELGFVRQAVGDHLLLGGDNMDLALAKFVETQAAAAPAGSTRPSTAC